MTLVRASWLSALAHAAALLPLAMLIWDFSQDRLTADPVKEIQLRTGRYALVLLMLALACTPAYLLSGVKHVLQFRPLLGTYAMMYAGLHFLNFIGLDYGFDTALIREDLFEKRFALAGFAGFVILLTLAVTSARGLRRVLGSNWRRLHWLVYIAALLAILHFLWAVKVDASLPLVYAGILAFLLTFRIPAIREIVSKRCRWVERKGQARYDET